MGEWLASKTADQSFLKPSFCNLHLIQARRVVSFDITRFSFECWQRFENQ